MAKINIDVLAGDLQKRITEMQAAGANLTPAWSAIGQNVIQRVRLGFRASQSPGGVPWAPLKVRQGQPLVDTGRLRRSIVQAATAQDVTVGTNLKYAPIHQFGGIIRAKNKPFLVFRTPKGIVRTKQVTIPARPFMPMDAAGNLALPPAWARSVLNVMLAHFGFNARATP